MITTGDWNRVRSLFQAVLEQPLERRKAFLDEACDGDENLRLEVASLLASHLASEGFLETPAARFDTTAERRELLTLDSGDRLGRFQIISALGAGGMGEVYRARDSQLGRDVALKILPPAFADDPQRLVRFERESRVLASLRHPNIAVIHSVEDLDGLRLLVLELVEGPTLAERLEQGHWAPAEALAAARQLAGALAAAHACGIVHRDVKPANLKISRSGHLTLLDFGLAKSPADVAAAGSTAAATIETKVGSILGTCGYMSPEQARGRGVDKRTDIWAFGCILFELLTGKAAFPGDTPPDVLAAVLEHQPDWTALPKGLPEPVHRLLRRCLVKDPDQRLHDIADARLEIDDALRQLEGTGEGVRPLDSRTRAGDPRRETPRPFAATRLVVPALLVVAAVFGWWLRGVAVPGSAATDPLVRSIWTLPPGLVLDSAPAISPDGRSLAFTASQKGAVPRLYVRTLDDLTAEAITGTDGAKQPFWSPDGRSLGYFAQGKLMRVGIGGSPIEVCEARDARGGAWGSTGIIVFSPNSYDLGLLRVPATGGTPEPVTLLDRTQRENSHRWPAFLPDGVHFVYFVRSGLTERRGVYLGDVTAKAAPPGAPLFRSESEAFFAAGESNDSGMLLNVAGGQVDVRPFDARRLAVMGDPIRLEIAAGGNTPHHGATLSASAHTVVYVNDPLPYGSRLVSALRSGSRLDRDATAGIINWPRVSPDGRRLVMQRLDPVTGNPDLWVQDLDRHTWLPVTRDGVNAQLPAWAPDSSRLAYVSGSLDAPRVLIGSADGLGEPQTLPCPRARCEPTDWSDDGRWIVVNALGPEKPSDVWMLPVGPGAAPRPLLTGSYVERDARLSPDGHFVAYVSGETGRPEISIGVITGSPRREVVSAGGGSQPVWTADGHELLFVDPQGALRSVAVWRGADGQPVLGAAARVPVSPIGTGHLGTQYDLSPDGRIVYFLDRQPDTTPREIGIAFGWRRLISAVPNR
jgi:eukaryotic-like serine/threonine-protein kinase